MFIVKSIENIIIPGQYYIPLKCLEMESFLSNIRVFHRFRNLDAKDMKSNAG